MRKYGLLCGMAISLIVSGIAFGAQPGGLAELRSDPAQGYGVSLVAGGQEKAGGKEKQQEGDGKPASDTKLSRPFGVDFDRRGDLYFVEYTGHRVRCIDKRGIVSTIAGTGDKGYSGDGGPGNMACLNSPHSLVVGPDGAIYVADTFNSCIRKIDPVTHKISTFAGTGQKGFSGDGGHARSALFGNVYCLAFSPNYKRLYVDDLDNRRIRMIDMVTGVVSTVAGNGERGVPADGSTATASPLLDPRAVAADGKGNLYILERSGHSLRVVDAAGKIRTVVGTGKAGPAHTGAGAGQAKSATLSGPKHLCVEATGDVLIADTDNHMIRRYRPGEESIEVVAGTGIKGNGGVGDGKSMVELNEPHGIYAMPDGTLYISDSMNDRILKLTPTSPRRKP